MIPGLRRGLFTLWRNTAERRSMLHILLAVLLRPAALLYRGLAALNRLSYESGLRRRVRVPAAVVSVGNIEVGGVGKTPVVIWMARRLSERGLSVAVVVRNQRSGPGCGREAVPADRVISVARRSSAGSMFSDEVLLLVQSLPGISVYAGKSKSKAAVRACREVSPDLVLVDDGFQHHGLQKDMEIVLVDFERPFGSGGLLPSGSLREPPCVLSRADCFWAHRRGQGRSEDWLRTRLDDYNWRAPLVCSNLIPGMLRLAGDDDSEIDPDGVSVVAFCGIGKPWSFRRTLEAAGCRVLGFMEFPDHHRYGAADLERLDKLRKARGAEALVTTTKDVVKIERLAESHLLYYLDTSLAVSSEAEQLLSSIHGLVSTGRGYQRV
ncbi:tetraacyldisaccharide 4'-kinase [Candidatus Fermentibacterales bacterium]|nr:tetraacyldisaccharide 4'-kinase [Candidatus Fermentibacterales bacterium]